MPVSQLYQIMLPDANRPLSWLPTEWSYYKISVVSPLCLLQSPFWPILLILCHHSIELGWISGYIWYGQACVPSFNLIPAWLVANNTCTQGSSVPIVRTLFQPSLETLISTDVKTKEKKIFHKAWKEGIKFNDIQMCTTCMKLLEANQEIIFCKLNQRRNSTLSQGLIPCALKALEGLGMTV